MIAGARTCLNYYVAFTESDQAAQVPTNLGQSFSLLIEAQIGDCKARVQGELEKGLWLHHGRSELATGHELGRLSGYNNTEELVEDV